MKEGDQFASPIFKKRFARRKTTHRPFTFARNFEADGSSPAKQNQIVSQVGDRGVVITSPVQLSRENEGLSITDIVRQSPVPVLIAHSSPKDKQKENTDHEEEDQLDAAQRRRSFRSREPSQQFLNRRQYPHGTPQHASVHHTPDEHYIGSKNNSNIDAEVSFTGEDGPEKGSIKNTSSLSSRSFKGSARVQTSQRARKRLVLDSSQSEDNIPGTKNLSGRKSSSKTPEATRKTSSVRKGRRQALDKTPQNDTSNQRSRQKKSAVRKMPPTPSPHRMGSLDESADPGIQDMSSSTAASKRSMNDSLLQGNKSKTLSRRDKGKTLLENRDALHSLEESDAAPESPPQVESKENVSVPRSRKKDLDKSKLTASATSSASRSGKLSRSISKVAGAGSAQKRSGSKAETSMQKSIGLYLSPIQEAGKGIKKSKVSKEVNGESSRIRGTDKEMISEESLSSSSSARRRKIASNDKEHEELSELSSAKRSRLSHLHETDKRGSRKESASKKKPVETSNMQPQKRSSSKRKVTPLKNRSENRSVLGKKSAVDLSVNENALQSGPRCMSPRSPKPGESPKRFFTDPDRTPGKLISNEIVGVQLSPRKGFPKSLNSFWKTSRRIDSSPVPRRQQHCLSQSSIYDDDNFGESEEGTVASRRIKRKKASHAKHQERGDSLPEQEEPKKRSKAVTELSIIMDMMDETELQLNEDSEMSPICLKAVHKAFNFTKKQLRQTEAQLMEIKEMSHQVNKLKSVCKAMSTESKENIQQKFMLQKELRSLHNQGIDADMMHIDRWLQDFQALRMSINS